MAKLRDLTGQRFGKLIVIERRGSNKRGRALWLCKCDCGNTTIAESGHLTNGYTKSCGCKKHDGNAQDLTGKRFGRLVVIERTENRGEKVAWKCQCDCGNISTATTDMLKSGRTKSCGCYSRECVSIRRSKGYSRRLRNTYNHMIQRCYNPNDSSYPNYGGRGITVCEEWRNSTDAFYEWAVKNGYNKDLSIDRIDVNGNYDPSNCRWADDYVQSNNRRNNVHIEYDGKTKTIKQWAEHFGFEYEKFRVLFHKVGMEKAIDTMKEGG